MLAVRAICAFTLRQPIDHKCSAGRGKATEGNFPGRTNSSSEVASGASQCGIGLLSRFSSGAEGIESEDHEC